MSEYIDKQAFNDELAKLVPWAIESAEDNAYMEGLNAAHNALVAPVKRGKWEPLSETQENSRNSLAMYRCSVCGRNSLQHRMGDRYCSQCGAEMEQSPGFRCCPFCGD